MTDVSQAVAQDEIANSLMGDPSESQTAEQPGTEQQDEFQQEVQPVETEGDTEQESEEWLPTDQDKVFPDEVYARYAERYQLTPEQASDPLLRQLLHDKINTDIFVRQQQQQYEQFEQEPEPQAQLEPTQQQPQLSREQYFGNLTRMVQERTDPQVAKDFHGEFLRAFGVPEAEIAATTPQQAMMFTNVMSKYALNLMNTFMDDMLGPRLTQHVSQSFPGFTDMYERSSHAMQWDKVRNSDPQFSQLPAYGTKEFSKTLREAADKLPEIADMIEEAKDKPMNAAQVGRWYRMLARVASGQSVDPALLQKAAAAGASNARRAAVRRSAGNLGSGKSTSAQGGSNGSRFQTNSDLFDDDTMNIWQREHGRL